MSDFNVGDSVIYVDNSKHETMRVIDCVYVDQFSKEVFTLAGLSGVCFRRYDGRSTVQYDGTRAFLDLSRVYTVKQHARNKAVKILSGECSEFGVYFSDSTTVEVATLVRNTLRNIQ